MKITKKIMNVEAEEQGNSYVKLDYFLSAVALQRREGPIAQEHETRYGLPRHMGRSLDTHNNEYTREYILPEGTARVHINERKVFYLGKDSQRFMDIVRVDADVEIKLFAEEPLYLRRILETAGKITGEKEEIISLDEVLCRDLSKYPYDNWTVAEAEKM